MMDECLEDDYFNNVYLWKCYLIGIQAIEDFYASVSTYS